MPANGGVVDPRFTAIDTAVNGDQGLYTIDFDITYDVAQMRSIPWQPPEETVDPVGNGQYPQRFFWVGMWGGSNGEPGSFKFTGFDQNSINPFDAQYDLNQFPVFHASFPLADFDFVPGSGVTEYRLGILYNSVFGTLPAPSNTTAVHIFFDNLRLTQLIPAEHIDYNGNGVADPEDWSLFMAQFLVNNPPAPVGNPSISFDLVGNFGAGAPMASSISTTSRSSKTFTDSLTPPARRHCSVPFPSRAPLALLAITIVGLVMSRSKQFALPLTMISAAALVFTLQQAAQAQLVEGWETLGNWTTGNSFAQGANPSVALETSRASRKERIALRLLRRS